MARIVTIGNAGGGKSTLARRLQAEHGLRHVEVDRFLWQDGWVPTSTGVYDRLYDDVIEQDAWVVDGLGRQASIPRRLARATEVMLVDMPLWMHFWLAAERQVAWAKGTLDHAPGGIAQAPPTEALFRTIWKVDGEWMPGIRTLCAEVERTGTIVHRLGSPEDLEQFGKTIGARA